MYMQESKDKKYRAEGNHLYEAQTDECGRTSYVHVYQDVGAKGINQLIARYLETSLADEEDNNPNNYY